MYTTNMSFALKKSNKFNRHVFLKKDQKFSKN